MEGLFTRREGALANQLAFTCISPNRDSEWAVWLFFERPLSTTNKMADQRNFLAASLIFLSLIPLAASFQTVVLHSTDSA